MTANNPPGSSTPPAGRRRTGENFLGRLSHRRHRGVNGITLVEAMIATAVFTTGILGVYAMMIYSYNMITLARYRDNARAVLMSFADKFERLQTTDSSGVLRNFFDTSVVTPNGVGLSWTDASGNVITYNSGSPATVPSMTWIDATGTTQTGTGTGITIMLGDPAGVQIPAIVSELVLNVDENTGATKIAGGNQAAGRILQGTFYITYTVKGRVQTQNLVVARSVR